MLFHYHRQTRVQQMRLFLLAMAFCFALILPALATLSVTKYAVPIGVDNQFNALPFTITLSTDDPNTDFAFSKSSARLTLDLPEDCSYPSFREGLQLNSTLAVAQYGSKVASRDVITIAQPLTAVSPTQFTATVVNPFEPFSRSTPSQIALSYMIYLSSQKSPFDGAPYQIQCTNPFPTYSVRFEYLDAADTILTTSTVIIDTSQSISTLFQNQLLSSDTSGGQASLHFNESIAHSFFRLPPLNTDLIKSLTLESRLLIVPPVIFQLDNELRPFHEKVTCSLLGDIFSTTPLSLETVAYAANTNLAGRDYLSTSLRNLLGVDRGVSDPFSHINLAAGAVLSCRHILDGIQEKTRNPIADLLIRSKKFGSYQFIIMPEPVEHKCDLSSIAPTKEDYRNCLYHSGPVDFSLTSPYDGFSTRSYATHIPFVKRDLPVTVMATRFYQNETDTDKSVTYSTYSIRLPFSDPVVTPRAIQYSSSSPLPDYHYAAELTAEDTQQYVGGTYIISCSPTHTNFATLYPLATGTLDLLTFSQHGGVMGTHTHPHTRLTTLSVIFKNQVTVKSAFDGLPDPTSRFDELCRTPVITLELITKTTEKYTPEQISSFPSPLLNLLTGYPITSSVSTPYSWHFNTFYRLSSFYLPLSSTPPAPTPIPTPIPTPHPLPIDPAISRPITISTSYNHEFGHVEKLVIHVNTTEWNRAARSVIITAVPQTHYNFLVHNDKHPNRFPKSITVPCNGVNTTASVVSAFEIVVIDESCMKRVDKFVDIDLSAVIFVAQPQKNLIQSLSSNDQTPMIHVSIPDFDDVVVAQLIKQPTSTSDYTDHPSDNHDEESSVSLYLAIVILFCGILGMTVIIFKLKQSLAKARSNKNIQPFITTDTDQYSAIE